MKVEDLPANIYAKQILKTIMKEKVCVLSGITGCGKSTQIPQIILQNDPNANIAVCEPRRIAATALASRVSDEMNDLPVGGKVGYHIGSKSRMSQKTQILYMTYGIFIQKLIHNKKFNHNYVILDEVHERSTDMDFVFVTLKKLLSEEKKENIRVIIMSATINSQSFTKYFSLHKTNETFLFPQILYNFSEGVQKHLSKVTYPKNKDSFIECPGYDIPVKRKFKVQEHYLDDLKPEGGKSWRDYEIIANDNRITDMGMEFGVKILAIWRQRNEGSVIVFLPGIGEITRFKTELQTHYKEFQNEDISRQIVIIHSSYSESLERRLFSKGEKIILATSMGESSITLPDCRLVVDYGLSKVVMTSHDRRGFDEYCTTRASKSNCIQRAGRVGRVQNGEVYRLMSYQKYQQMEEFQQPEIKMVSLELLVLKVKRMAENSDGNQNYFEDPYDFIMNCIDPPDAGEVHKAVHFAVVERALQSLGDLGNEKRKYRGKHLKITPLGKFIADLPCSFSVSRMLLVAIRLGIGKIMTDIGSILMSQKNFFLSEDSRKQCYQFYYHLTKYDRGHLNDFTLQQRVFEDWKEQFFVPFCLECEKKKNKNCNKSNKNNEDDDDSGEVFQNDDCFLDKNVDYFCSKQVSEKERKWLQERGISLGAIRDILKASENIRLRLLKHNVDIQNESSQVPNCLVLLCLEMAFPEIIVELNFYYDKYKKKSMKIIPISFELNENLSQQEFRNELAIFLHPDKPYSIKRQGNKMIVEAQSSRMQRKLTLDWKHKKTIEFSDAFYSCLFSARQKMSITNMSKDQARVISKDPGPAIIHKESILSNTFEINCLEKYLLITNKVGYSKKNNNYHINTAALINEAAYYLTKMITCQTLQIGKHQQFGFIQMIKMDGKSKFMPFRLTRSLLNKVLQIRQICIDSPPEKENYLQKINKEDKDTLIDLFTKEPLLQGKEKWEHFFERQTGISERQELTWLNFRVKIERQFSDYYDFYKRWKKITYYKTYEKIKKLSVQKPVIVCAGCLDDDDYSIFKVIDLFENFNRQTRLLEIKNKKLKFKSSKLYCKNNHVVGFKIDQDNVHLLKDNVKIYFPYDVFTPLTVTNSDLKVIRKTALQKYQLQKDSFSQFNCKVCITSLGEQIGIGFSQFEFRREREQNLGDFMKNICSHFKSDYHRQNHREFINNL